jgi:hypothetical protein
VENGITQEEADELIKPFSMEEIKSAVFQMEHNKAPRPDGFMAEFYQYFWELIKNDLHSMLNDFYGGNLNIARLNYGIINLVPKCKDAKQIQTYRPICVLNVVLNFFTKILMNRLSVVVSSVISPVQTAFVRGRFILEGVVVPHEALNLIHVEKQSAMLFKVYFEKAYDKFKWPFVCTMLKMKGFLDAWRDWIMSIMRGRHVGMKK